MFTAFKQLIGHGKQLAELRQDVDALARDFKRLELEWTDMYDRIHRTLMKVSKRAQREEHAGSDGGSESAPAEANGSAVTGGDGSLAARREQLNAQIRARRERRTSGLLPG